MLLNTLVIQTFPSTESAFREHLGIKEGNIDELLD